MAKIRASFTVNRMKNAWAQVEEDEEIKALFMQVWAGNRDLDIKDEKNMVMVRGKITKKIFNARCGTTFYGFKRISIKAASAGYVSFRNCLKAAGSTAQKAIAMTSTKDIEDEFDFIEDMINQELLDAKNTEKTINFDNTGR